MKLAVKWTLIASIIFVNASPSLALSTKEEIAQLKERLTVLEKRLEQQEMKKTSKLTTLTEDISVEAGATVTYQTTSNANGDDLSENSQEASDASYSLDVTITKEFESGTAFIALEAGEGAGVDEELKVFSAVNADATGGDSNIGVTEAWYQHNFEPFLIAFGKIAGDTFLDANEYANDETTQFLGTGFKNSPTIEFPENGGGLLIGAQLSTTLNAEAVVMDGNADWEDMFEDIFYGVQLTYSPEISGRSGNYRVFGWGNSQDHTKWKNSSKTQEASYGFGLSFDQYVSDNIGIFARYAWQNPEVFLNGNDISLEHSYSLGLQVSGKSWGRVDDAIGVAFGQIVASNDYKDAGSNLKADPEGHVEVYYSWKLNDHLTISPDIQIIMNPYGGDATNGDDTIVIGGLRGQVDF